MDYDSSFLEPEAGQRALWLLYRYGAWGYLEDLGMNREKAEPAFHAFDAANVVSKRLTRVQCRQLEESVPGFKEARIELQLAYALRIYEEQDKKGAKKNGSSNGKRRSAAKVLPRRGSHRTRSRLRSAG